MIYARAKTDSRSLLRLIAPSGAGWTRPGALLASYRRGPGPASTRSAAARIRLYRRLTLRPRTARFMRSRAPVKDFYVNCAEISITLRPPRYRMRADLPFARVSPRVDFYNKK